MRGARIGSSRVCRACIVSAFVASAAAGLACRSRTPAQTDGEGVFVPQPVAEAGAAEAGPGFGLGAVDRAGRPFVAVLLVPGSLQDDYNAASTFDASASRTFGDAVAARLQALDTTSLDGGAPDPVDWPLDGGAAPLLAMLATDSLLVDTARSCVADGGGFAASYLDVEREVFFGGAPHATCGGRTPNDDVVDAMLTLLITNGRLPVTQGVSGATKPAGTSFPYLADPN